MLGLLFAVVALLIMALVVTALAGPWGMLLFGVALIVGLGGAAS